MDWMLAKEEPARIALASRRDAWFRIPRLRVFTENEVENHAVCEKSPFLRRHKSTRAAQGNGFGVSARLALRSLEINVFAWGGVSSCCGCMAAFHCPKRPLLSQRSHHNSPSWAELGALRAM